MPTDEVPGLVAHLFRHQAGRLVALLTRALGARHLQLAEDVVQDALVAALHTWPLHGVPANPPAWLMQVARRKAIDVLRRHRAFTDRTEPRLLAHLALSESDGTEAVDDTLSLMFLTCHPALPAESRIALTLKVAGGFSVEEIARGLFADPRAVAQRLVRAKRRLRDQDPEMVLPAPAHLPARLESVLDSLSLMFTTGYGAGEGEALIHEEVCLEAVRLARLLVQHPHTTTPDSHACVALLLLQAARLPARVADSGNLTVLSRQDRSRWLWPLVHEALHHLDRSIHGSRMSRWHLQAGIAALHATGAPFDGTPWDRIVTLYDDLVVLQPTGVVRLNRAIALGMRDGPRAGLAAVREVLDDPRLATYHLLHAAHGHFLGAVGDTTGASDAYTRALGCPVSAPERRFLLGRITSLT